MSRYFTRLCCLFICVTLITVVSGGRAICGLRNYDIQTIERREYWSFNISSSNCAAETGDDATCTVYFTLCKELPSHLCGGDKNSGMCQKVPPKESGKEDRYYSMGMNMDKVYKQKKSIGFFAVYPNGSNKTTVCKNNAGTTVIMFYTCNKTALWDTTIMDVTQYLRLYEINPSDQCQITVNIHYSGACVRDIPVIAGCNSLRHFNLSSLRSKPLWLAKVPLENCKDPYSSNKDLAVKDDDTCSLMFSFCQPLPAGVCYDSIFCQQGLFGSSISMGSYNEKLKIGPNQDYAGFTIQAYGGTNTTKCPGGLYSTMIFNCSENANWTNADISKFTTAYPDADDCEFLVIFQYDGACTSHRPPEKVNKAHRKVPRPYWHFLQSAVMHHKRPE